ncbi:MAG: glutamate--tRNA ligase, partial [Ktedonobacterales bacterium]
LAPEERERRIAAGESYVVRLAVPEQGTTRVYDELRGEILFENATLDDAVLLKSNGYPTYHLAHVVDDHLMAITHVIRAEEWIPSAPLHVLEYAALGWELPRLVHVPDVLGHDGKKLSKRHGALPLLAYRDMGYLPEALLNYMALLGWSYDDKTDILSPDQIIAAFTLDRVGTSAARFDAERLLWMNGVYIRRLSPEMLVEQTLPFLERREAEGGLPDSVERPLDRGYVRRVLLLEQERMKTLADAAPATAFFFDDELEYAPDLLITKQMDAQRTLEGLREAQAVLAAQPEWEAPQLEHAARDLVARLGLKPGQLFSSLRVAVTGRTVSPPLFETMEVLGRQRSLERIAVAIARLESRVA